MLVCFRALIAILFVLPLPAQQPPGGAVRAPRKAATAAPAPKPDGLTADGIVAMVEAGLSDDIIVARLRKEDKPLDLSTDDLIRLKKAKVSDAVLKVMMDPKADIRPQPAPSVPSAPATQPVVIQTPLITGIPAAHPSGATPAPGAAVGGDPDDPQAPHDSGIYLYGKDREGKLQMVALERAGYQGSKTGGLFTSALTYGIAKAKTKAVIPGPRAGIRVTDPAPVFYFYFDDKQTGLGKTSFGSSNLSNPNQFALLKLDVNKQNRETIIGQFSMLGGSSGSDSKSMVPFKSERIRPGLYKVTVETLKPGEYCFLGSSGMVTSGMASVYGMGTAGSTDIFDFGMSVE